MHLPNLHTLKIIQHSSLTSQNIIWNLTRFTDDCFKVSKTLTTFTGIPSFLSSLEQWDATIRDDLEISPKQIIIPMQH